MRLFFLAIFAFLTSCVAYQSGGLTSTSAGSNFIYEDLAIGTAQSNRVFGLGGMRKDALVLEAKRQLMTARPLQKNEEYINFTVDFKRSFFPILDRTKVTVSADVIKYTDATPTERYSSIYQTKMFVQLQKDSLFSVGDLVYTKNYLSGQILTISKNEMAKVSFQNKKGHIKTKKIALNDLYSRTIDVYNGLNPGDFLTLSNFGIKSIYKIAGLGKKDLLLMDDSGKFLLMDYPEKQ